MIMLNDPVQNWLSNDCTLAPKSDFPGTRVCDPYDRNWGANARSKKHFPTNTSPQ
jgi:hypothetical protein